MADTKIEWATKVWNFVRGCRRVSLGCGGAQGVGGCYAEKQAYRFSGPGKQYEGLVTLGAHGPRWTGMGRFVPEKLPEPMRIRAPKDGSRHRFFVNSMSDLFFEEFTNEQIAAGFGIMAACPEHDFLILTKRPERMLEWFQWCERRGNDGLAVFPDDPLDWRIRQMLNVAARSVGVDMSRGSRQNHGGPWPLLNVWIGVSAEDQKTADERIPLLLRCPAAIRFVSYEPALGPVDLRRWLVGSQTRHLCVSVSGTLRNRNYGGLLCDEHGRALSVTEAKRELERLRDAGVRVIKGDPSCDNFDDQTGCLGHRNERIDWVICGGESGNGARPFDVDWAYSTIKQCRDSGVACYVKQLGALRGFTIRDVHDLDLGRNIKDRKGGDMAEWPDDLRVREFPQGPHV